MDEVVILVGTETGSAEDVADHLAATLEELGVEQKSWTWRRRIPPWWTVAGPSSYVPPPTVTESCRTTRGTSTRGWSWSSRILPASYSACVGSGTTPTRTSAREAGSGAACSPVYGATEVIKRYEIDGFPEEEDIEGSCEWVERAIARFEELAGERGRRSEST